MSEQTALSVSYRLKTCPKTTKNDPKENKPYMQAGDICLVAKDISVTTKSKLDKDTITNTLKAGSPVLIKQVEYGKVLVEDADGMEWTVLCYKDNCYPSFGEPINTKLYRDLTGVWGRLRYKIAARFGNTVSGFLLSNGLLLLLGLLPMFISEMVGLDTPSMLGGHVVFPCTLLGLSLGMTVIWIANNAPDYHPSIIRYHSHYKTMSRELKTLFRKSNPTNHPPTKNI